MYDTLVLYHIFLHHVSKTYAVPINNDGKNLDYTEDQTHLNNIREQTAH